MCDTIKSSCCCEEDDQPAEAAASSGRSAAPLAALLRTFIIRPLLCHVFIPKTGAFWAIWADEERPHNVKSAVAEPAVPQVTGAARAITANAITSVEFCSATGRLFCLSYTESTHARSLVVFDAASGNEVGRLAHETIASGCHSGGGPICVGGRLLIFGENDRFFQIYDCATLEELYVGPNPQPGKCAHEDAIRDAKVISGDLFTSTYHYSRRWSLGNVLATPAGPPMLLTEYKGTTPGSEYVIHRAKTGQIDSYE